MNNTGEPRPCSNGLKKQQNSISIRTNRTDTVAREFDSNAANATRRLRRQSPNDLGVNSQSFWRRTQKLDKTS